MRTAARVSAWITVLALTGVACASASDSLSGDAEETNTADEAPRDPDATFFWEEPGVEHESLIPLNEIVSGGPPPDGIPPIDDPKFVDPGTADAWLDDDEPVMVLEIDGDARAYPLQILLWHEIVNDVVGGRPVSVTYCPLCNSAIVFDRTVNGNVLSYGTSGRLYNSDLVMYDRQTKSLWVQFTGQAVVGPMIRTELEAIPSPLVNYADFKDQFPEGRVLSRDTGFNRSYGVTPYSGYDTNDDPFLFRGSVDPKLPAIARVVGVKAPSGNKAYALDALRELGSPAIVNDTVGDDPVVVLWKKGTASTLDNRDTAQGRDVGSSAVFLRRVEGQTLTFERQGKKVVDEQTGSSWNFFGESTAGSMKGTTLERINRVDTFWFAWSVFTPDAPLWTGG